MIAKFRIWDEKYNCWSKESILAYPGPDYCEELKKQGRTIQWYTGIKDKNGKEIYQGDIVEWGELKYLVEWNDIAYKWQGRCPNYHQYHHPKTENFRELSSGSIVGNIFELPCDPDHNGECMLCDELCTLCPFKKQK